MKYKSVSEGKIITQSDYSKRIIFSFDEFKEKGHLLQTVTIPPRTKQRQHYHNKQIEVFYILTGEAVININAQDYTTTTGDAFICEPGDKHFVWNKSDKEFRLVVFKINYQLGSDDTIWIE